MKRNYHTLDNQGNVNERKLSELLSQNGQQILPMVELITQSRMAIDDLVDVVGRAMIETVLQLSAEQVAGPPQQGRRRQGEIVWHGKQAGSVYLKERKLKVDKPRLRKRGGAGRAKWRYPPTRPCKIARVGDRECWKFCWKGYRRGVTKP